MAVTLQGASPILVGLSTDDKPDGAVNQLFHELDTNDYYYFDGEAWAKVGGESTPAVEGGE